MIDFFIFLFFQKKRNLTEHFFVHIPKLKKQEKEKEKEKS